MNSINQKIKKKEMELKYILIRVALLNEPLSSIKRFNYLKIYLVWIINCVFNLRGWLCFNFLKFAMIYLALTSLEFDRELNSLKY